MDPRQWIEENYPTIAKKSDLIATMPDLRGFRSQMAIEGAQKWTEDERYNTIVDELEMIVSLGGEQEKVLELLLEADGVYTNTLWNQIAEFDLKTWVRSIPCTSYILFNSEQLFPLLFASAHPILQHGPEYYQKTLNLYSKAIKFQLSKNKHRVVWTDETHRLIKLPSFILFYAADYKTAHLLLDWLDPEVCEEALEEYDLGPALAAVAFDDAYESHPVINALISSLDVERLTRWIASNDRYMSEDRGHFWTLLRQRPTGAVEDEKLQAIVGAVVRRMIGESSFYELLVDTMGRMTDSTFQTVIGLCDRERLLSCIQSSKERFFRNMIYNKEVERVKQLLSLGVSPHLEQTTKETNHPIWVALRSSPEIATLLLDYYDVKPLPFLLQLLDVENSEPMDSKGVCIELLLQRYEYSDDDLIVALDRTSCMHHIKILLRKLMKRRKITQEVDNQPAIVYRGKI